MASGLPSPQAPGSGMKKSRDLHEKSRACGSSSACPAVYAYLTATTAASASVEQTTPGCLTKRLRPCEMAPCCPADAKPRYRARVGIGTRGFLVPARKRGEHRFAGFGESRHVVSR